MFRLAARSSSMRAPRTSEQRPSSAGNFSECFDRLVPSLSRGAGKHRFLRAILQNIG